MAATAAVTSRSASRPLLQTGPTAALLVPQHATTSNAQTIKKFMAENHLHGTETEALQFAIQQLKESAELIGEYEKKMDEVRQLVEDNSKWGILALVVGILIFAALLVVIFIVAFVSASVLLIVAAVLLLIVLLLVVALLIFLANCPAAKPCLSWCLKKIGNWVKNPCGSKRDLGENATIIQRTIRAAKTYIPSVILSVTPVMAYVIYNAKNYFSSSPEVVACCVPALSALFAITFIIALARIYEPLVCKETKLMLQLPPRHIVNAAVAAENAYRGAVQGMRAP